MEIQVWPPKTEGDALIVKIKNVETGKETTIAQSVWKNNDYNGIAGKIGKSIVKAIGIKNVEQLK